MRKTGRGVGAAQWVTLLERASLLPPANTVEPNGSPDPDQLLAWLSSHWQHFLRRKNRPFVEQTREGLGKALARANLQHARLTYCMPGPARQRVAAWAGPRLIWWPRGIPNYSRLAIVSSRLGRPIETRPSWFRALRIACRDVDPARAMILTCEKSAADRFVMRCADLFELPILAMRLARARRTAGQWLLECLKAARKDLSDTARQPGFETIWNALISPPLAPDPDENRPLQDRLLIAAANRLFACRIRPGGHVDSLLERRLSEAGGVTIPATVAIGLDLVDRRVADRLRRRGAKTIVVSGSSTVARSTRFHDVCHAELGRARIVTLEQLSSPDSYLTHCTRHQAGPWPDQDEQTYLDDLILDRPSADHAPLAALRRMLVQQRMTATSRTIRGGTPVVCFTAVPVDHIRQLRTYRRHRGRWDFQPYGICISRRWLSDRGARPVRYGTPSLWEKLSPEERPFFQSRYSGLDQKIDWSVEREWRHVGDVLLDQLPADAGLLLVADLAEAEQLQPLSRWPIVVID